MKDLNQSIINILVNDSTLASLMNTTVPNKQIFTGNVDLIMETKSTINFPAIILSGISEVFRTVPLGARDSRIQLDIWDRTSELDIENIYERVVFLLNYQSGDINTTHIFWQRGSGLTSQYESDMRLWHWTTDLTLWSI